MNLKIKKLVVVFFFITMALFFICPKGWAEGEVININEKLQIVFTGLGNNVLKRGDIVKVLINENDFIYLEVIEVSPILSKLAPVNRGGFKTDLSQFSKLAIGNPVVQLSEDHLPDAAPVKASEPDKSPAPVKTTSLEDELQFAKDELAHLQQDNLALKKEVQRLSTDNQTLNQDRTKEIGQLKSLITELKARLENMNKMLQDNEK
jgi:hypothetical protein